MPPGATSHGQAQTTQTAGSAAQCQDRNTGTEETHQHRRPASNLRPSTFSTFTRLIARHDLPPHFPRGSARSPNTRELDRGLVQCSLGAGCDRPAGLAHATLEGAVVVCALCGLCLGLGEQFPRQPVGAFPNVRTKLLLAVAAVAPVVGLTFATAAFVLRIG